MRNQNRSAKKALGLFTLLGWGIALHAQSSDALIDKLVQKGILTVKEANELRDETDKNFSLAHAVKTGLPDWVASLRFNGDIRLRYDHITNVDPSAIDRDRFRYRLRFGYTAVLLDDWEVGFAFASGQNDPVSTNQTLDDNAVKKPVTLDKVYARWTPVNKGPWLVNTTLGKMEQPLAFPSTLLFDNDYMPEGLAQEVSFKLTSKHSLKATGVAFVLDEVAASSRDPYLLGGQLRWDAEWSPKWHSSAGVTHLSIVNGANLVNGAVPDISGGNTRLGPTGVPAYSYNTLYLDGALTYKLDKFPLYEGAFPITVSGDFTRNSSAPANNLGYSVGLTLGKAGKKKLWELNWRYTELQADAWYEELVESDFGAFYKTAAPGTPATAIGYRSGTNVRGHWIKGTYNVYDSFSFSIAYFLTDLINEPGLAPYDSGSGRLFLEGIWKF